MCVYVYMVYILFNYDLSQDIEHSSLGYTVTPCCLSILHNIIITNFLLDSYYVWAMHCVENISYHI